MIMEYNHTLDVPQSLGSKILLLIYHEHYLVQRASYKEKQRITNTLLDGTLSRHLGNGRRLASALWASTW